MISTLRLKRIKVSLGFRVLKYMFLIQFNTVYLAPIHSKCRLKAFYKQVSSVDPSYETV